MGYWTIDLQLSRVQRSDNGKEAAVTIAVRRQQDHFDEVVHFEAEVMTDPSLNDNDVLHGVFMSRQFDEWMSEDYPHIVH
ncbi:MAG: hypothetical protein JNM76_07550 [Betaproteobacteria bacterium]|jgi:hypothetical protein|nr:hypothetical protein [Betaproteobacteria bacterium]